MVISRRRTSVNLLVFGGIVLFGTVGAIIYTLYDSHKPIERQSGPILHEAYVWQRQWDAALAEAVGRAAANISGFTVLGAEVSFKGGAVDQVVRVAVDYDALPAADGPIGLALRIGPYSGPFDEESDNTRLLADIAVSIVADACDAGLKPVELQIDFDCAESKLSGYRQWVEVFRREVRPVPVVVTALPSWLKRRAFARLARASDGFVLQVHSLERPKGPDAKIVLCDSKKAVGWVEKAARCGVPFRVALPTYGYIVAFDKNGGFIGLSAEGPSRAWADDVQLRAVRSDPVAMAGLVDRWQTSRPANMEGIIWYRLPVDTDRLNWKWQTLSCVMTGRAAPAEPQVVVEYPEPELAEVYLLNSGAADLSPAVRIELEFDRDKLLASDALRGFALAEENGGKILIEYAETTPLAVIAPGRRWKVAWLRFKERTEIQTNVRTDEF